VHELVAQISRARQGQVSDHGNPGALPAHIPGSQLQPLERKGNHLYPTTPEKEHFERAMNYYHAVSSIPNPADDWEKRGGKLFTMHDYDGATNAYQQALELNGSKATTWLALGDSHFALENYSDALRAYEQAMHLDPNDPQTWSNRGTTLDALGRHKEAIDCYERADQLQ